MLQAPLFLTTGTLKEMEHMEETEHEQKSYLTLKICCFKLLDISFLILKHMVCYTLNCLVNGEHKKPQISNLSLTKDHGIG